MLRISFIELKIIEMSQFQLFDKLTKVLVN